MIRSTGIRSVATILALLLCPATARAQHTHHPAPRDTAAHRHAPARPAPRSTPRAAPRRSPPHAAHGDAPASGHARHESGAHERMMPALYGSYSMTREASGTAWQPEAARHEGVHLMRGAWSIMLHGFADLVYDRQGGERGDEKVFGANMAMAMARRDLGPGALGLRAMLSLEPATIGEEGYPLLLQTGETANGETPLIDRQHPHDLFMELAATWSVSRGGRSGFLYAGLPGEPALGPPAFMHRYSGMNAPLAPISHHWLDSSHITFGVLTGGVVIDRVKLEASAFRGREPDEERWDLEEPSLDSHAFRLSFNPSERWALQVSHGRLESPEQLESEVDQDRSTASAMHEGRWGATGRWQATLAWGRNRSRPGPTLDSVLLEGAAEWSERHTAFARAERVEKHELFAEPDPRAHEAFVVGQLTVGYRADLWRRGPFTVGIGAAGSRSYVPAALEGVYGDSPFSGVVFLHAAIR